MSILCDIEAFMERTKIPAATFGHNAVKDPRFVFDLRRGREPGPKTIERVEEYMRNEGN